MSSIPPPAWPNAEAFWSSNDRALDMARAVRFYEALGFSKAYGGETAAFTSFRVGKGSLNLARVVDRSGQAGLPLIGDQRGHGSGRDLHERTRGLSDQELRGHRTRWRRRCSLAARHSDERYQETPEEFPHPADPVGSIDLRFRVPLPA